ncbi:MAG: AI-2E family transporter [Clostridia bacterium]|nr:AI-2E family transporter [Clostridia bacterium]
MKVSWKGCLRIATVAFLLYLAITYWPTVFGTFTTFLGTLSPLLIGFAIAYIVNIIMCSYERLYFPLSRNKFLQKTRRVVCMTLAYITVGAIIALVGWLVLPQLISAVETLLIQIPGVMANVIQTVEEWNILPPETLNSLKNFNWFTTVQDLVNAFMGGWGDMMGTVVGTVQAVFSAAVTTLLSLIFSIYFLIKKDHLRHQLVRVFDHFVDVQLVDKARRFLALLHDCFRRFIIGQCTEAVILGLLCTIGMWIFGFPYATMIGALIAFTALIPIAGAYIGAGIGAFMIFTVSPLKALLFLVFILVLQQLEGNLIYPHVVGSSIGLPGLWVLVAVTIGGGIAGVLGMLISVPIAAAIYRLLQEELETDRPESRKLHLFRKKAPISAPAAETSEAPEVQTSATEDKNS